MITMLVSCSMGSTETCPAIPIDWYQIAGLAVILALAIFLIIIGARGRKNDKPKWWNSGWDADEPVWPGPAGGELLPVGGTDDRTRKVRDDAQTHPRLRS